MIGRNSLKFGKRRAVFELRYQGRVFDKAKGVKSKE